MRVAITLDEEEQDAILGIAGRGTKPYKPHMFISMADKVEKAREDPFLNEVTE